MIVTRSPVWAQNTLKAHSYRPEMLQTYQPLPPPSSFSSSASHARLQQHQERGPSFSLTEQSHRSPKPAFPLSQLQQRRKLPSFLSVFTSPPSSSSSSSHNSQRHEGQHWGLKVAVREHAAAEVQSWNWQSTQRGTEEQRGDNIRGERRDISQDDWSRTLQTSQRGSSSIKQAPNTPHDCNNRAGAGQRWTPPSLAPSTTSAAAFTPVTVAALSSAYRQTLAHQSATAAGQRRHLTAEEAYLQLLHGLAAVSRSNDQHRRVRAARREKTAQKGMVSSPSSTPSVSSLLQSSNNSSSRPGSMHLPASYHVSSTPPLSLPSHVSHQVNSSDKNAAMQETGGVAPVHHYAKGRWSREEQKLFLNALRRYGKDWRQISTVIRTRSILQIRTHAQKVLLKMVADAIALGSEIDPEFVSTEDLTISSTSCGSTTRRGRKRKQPLAGFPSPPVTPSSSSSSSQCGDETSLSSGEALILGSPQAYGGDQGRERAKAQSEGRPADVVVTRQGHHVALTLGCLCDFQLEQYEASQSSSSPSISSRTVASPSASPSSALSRAPSPFSSSIVASPSSVWFHP